MTSETSTSAPVPVSTVHRGVAVLWLVVCCAATAGCLLATARISFFSGAYQAGSENLDPPFVLTSGEVLWLVTGAASVIVLVVASLKPRSAARHFARGELLACLVAVPLSCADRPSPEVRYEDGFMAWARSQVQAEPIRNWEASRPSVGSVTAVSAAQWPPAVASLHPDDVIELPAKRGLVLEWGRLAAWGTARRVSITADATVAPPSDDEFIHFAWRLFDIGAYAAFQDRS